MQIDFTKLAAIGQGEAPAEKPLPQIPQAAKIDAGQYKNTSAGENAAEGLETQKTEFPQLQREADNRKQALQAAAEVYKKYQQNIAATELLQAQILKGIRNQENIYSLFLTAAQALSLTISNREFYQQILRELPQYYPEAAGLQE